MVPGQFVQMPVQCTDLNFSYAECTTGICISNDHYGTWYQLSTSFNDSYWYLALECTSSLVAALFGAYVLYTKELQVHPMRLIMYLAFVESIYQYLLIQSTYICRLRLNELLAWTLYYSNDAESLNKATVLLVVASDMFAVTSFNVSVGLNTSLCVDLILMVHYPFTKKEGRISIYLAVSVLVGATIATLMVLFDS